MKKEVSPAMLVIAGVVALAIIGGVYYQTLGPGSRAGRSKVASPYSIPTSAADFQKPLPTGSSGVNAITGERLPESATAPAVPPGLAVGAPQSGGKSGPR